MTRPSTGLRPLDDLIGGVRIGDNLVFEGDGEVSLDSFVSAFVQASSKAAGLAYVSLHVPPSVVLDRFAGRWHPQRTVLVDLYTDGLGGSDAAFERFYRSRRARSPRIERLREVADPDGVRASMSALEDELGPDTRYVFDSLTGMQEVWGADEALSFFLRSCPRLYELRTVALWVLDRSAHDPSFLSRLTRVTQVVVRIETADDGFGLRVVKAEGRAPEVVGRRATIRFEAGRARLVHEQEAGAKERVGALLREARRTRGLSQAELARRIGISPSALSQAERGAAGLSGATLTRAWTELGMPFGGDDRPAPGPYRVARRGNRPQHTIAPGVEAEQLVGSSTGPGMQLVRFARGSSGRRPPFTTKLSEVVVVVSGVLELRIGDGTEALHAGDAIEISTETIASWRNLAPHETVAIWSMTP
jgi:DNA-binding XRE family transcriptional regulator/quercetin dioxygenase-like cupin family protein